MAGVTQYTEEMADKICEELSTSSISLKTLCTREDFPAQSTVYKWLSENKDFSEKYARAREEQASVMAEEILAIADDSRNDNETRYDAKGEPYVVEDKEWVNRSKLRIDARKWLASKLAPKKYGERITQDINLKEVETTVEGIDPPECEK